jgi:hypothetical protein
MPSTSPPELLHFPVQNISLYSPSVTQPFCSHKDDNLHYQQTIWGAGHMAERAEEEYNRRQKVVMTKAHSSPPYMALLSMASV